MTNQTNAVQASNENQSALNGHLEQKKLLANGIELNNNENKMNLNEYENESASSLEQPKLLWTPKATQINQDLKLKEFQALINDKYSLNLVKLDFEVTYDDLYKWSIDNHLVFWEEFWHFSGIIHSKSYDRVLDKPNVSMDDLPFKWFDGALMNYAENLLRHNDERVAVYSYGEAFKSVKSITFKDLREKVGICQIAMRKAGVSKGDCVAGYLPNCIEALVIKLATISLGALWSCTSPDFGSHSVIDRFKQIKPKLIFSVTSVAYNGKKHDHKCKLIEVLNGVDSLQQAVIVPFFNDSIDPIDEIPNAIEFSEFLKLSDEELKTELYFEQVPFSYPMVILFSSGTTGIPKCIVHSHGGTLIQHLKEHILLGNLSREDIMFFYTTTGWMMYNWLISSLFIGSAIVIFDGSPFIPSMNVLWDLVDQLGITMFGTSAKWLSVIEDKHCKPMETHKLKSLKIIYSTGSPLKPSSFDYVYRSIKKDIIVGSITGGTDIISLFCGHNVNLPVYCGEIQCRHLGMAVECWNEDGKAVFNEPGELVCVKPFPSMPVFFLNDPDFKKYKSSYFEKFPGVWAHGDFCMINKATGGVSMFGRSDGTLNPNGIRFGSADIYNIISEISEIEDSLCVGQKNPTNQEEERVILFLKLKPEYEFNKQLVDKVKSKIRADLSARHVPSLILPIHDIPYTLNGKKVEVPVRRIIEGINVTLSSSIVNPASIEPFRHIEDLKKW